MKFYALTDQIQEQTELLKEYKAGHEIGVIRLGENCLFFRRFRKIYYCPYSEIRYCFRRVMLVQAKLCCGKGNLEVENLVICNETSEIAQIQLPGTRAAKILVDELKVKIPDARFSKPAFKTEKNE